MNAAGAGPAGAGSLTAELTALAGIARAWLAAHAPEATERPAAAAGGAPGASGDASASVSDPDPDVADDPGPRPGSGLTACQFCPVCRLLAAVGGDRPEVLAQLFAAAGSLAAAWRALLAAHAAHAAGTGPSGGGGGAGGPGVPRGRADVDHDPAASGDHPRHPSRIQRIDIA